MKSALGITLFITLMASLNTQVAHAQNPNNALRRGNFTIGSGLGYVNSVTDIEIDNGNTVVEGGNSAYALHITPVIGYFFARNFVFGMGMDYIVSASKDNNEATPETQRSSDTKLLFGPFSRIYFPFAGDQALFLGGVYGYGKSQTEIADAGETHTVNTTLMTFGAGPGYSIFSNDRVSLEAHVKYNYGISRNTFYVGGVSQSTRTLTTAWDFVIGMHFYFSGNNGRGGQRQGQTPTMRQTQEIPN